MKDRLTMKEASTEFTYYQMMAACGHIDEDLLQPIARFILSKVDPAEIPQNEKLRPAE